MNDERHTDDKRTINIDERGRPPDLAILGDEVTGRLSSDATNALSHIPLP